MLTCLSSGLLWRMQISDMQHRWYSDNRDIVKWATLLHLARAHRVRCIVHVVFLRPSLDWREAKLKSDTGRFSIEPEIWEHFPRDVARIRGLAEMSGLAIRVFGEPFDVARRTEYVTRIAGQISESGDGRKIVLLDPDNGIAPRHANGRHVTAAEVALFWSILQPRDWLVLYQHRQRSAHWLGQTREQFAAACGCTARQVQTFTCREIAHDVAFFALHKTCRTNVSRIQDYE